MALPANLSEKALSKFRTKLCERVLATGTCSFGDRCQYSHTAPARRNPRKVAYATTMCLDAEKCPDGTDCSLAHSVDEIRYHPLMYKRLRCQGGTSCDGYYCPDAHTPEEVARAAGGEYFDVGCAVKSKAQENFLSDDNGVNFPAIDAQRPSRTKKRGLQSAVVPVRKENATPQRFATQGVLPLQTPTPLRLSFRETGNAANDKYVCSEVDSVGANCGKWWHVGDQRDLRVSLTAMNHPTRPNVGAALLGGTYRYGRFGSSSDVGVEKHCVVKMISVGRGETLLVGKTVKEMKRWISRTCRKHVLRRTVATTALVIFPERCVSLASSVQAAGVPLTERIMANWQLLTTAAEWASQLLDGVNALHREGIVHGSLCPSTVSVRNGTIQIDDFFGKVKLLKFLQHGWPGAFDESWAVWYPPDITDRISEVRDACVKSSQPNVAADGSQPPTLLPLPEGRSSDAWQAGVTIFYMFTGTHLFGNVDSDANGVFKNTKAGVPINLPLMLNVPVVADLITRFTAHLPSARLLPEWAPAHPALWNNADSGRFAASALGRPTEGQPSCTEASFDATLAGNFYDKLRHLPSLASLGPSTRPPGQPVQLVSELCDVALASLGDRAKMGDERPSKGSAGAQHTSIGTVAANAAGHAAFERLKRQQARRHAVRPHPTFRAGAPVGAGPSLFGQPHIMGCGWPLKENPGAGESACPANPCNDACWFNLLSQIGSTKQSGMSLFAGAQIQSVPCVYADFASTPTTTTETATSALDFETFTGGHCKNTAFAAMLHAQAASLVEGTPLDALQRRLIDELL